MYRYYEYCPKCDGLRAMNVSISLKTVTAQEGDVQEILVKNYHCETCSSFIYSAIDAEEEEKAGYFELQPSLPYA